MKCRSPRCPSDRAEGSGFCEHHRDLFAAVASEINAGKTARLRSPGRKRRRAVLKSCDTPGCEGHAAPRESYCAECLSQLAREPQ
jgi:hypothetical protein